MTLFDIIRNLQAIAAQEPSVRSVSDGDIYDALNAAVDIRYGCFHITQDTHTTNGDLDVWGLNLFYIDRLLDNGENRLSIQSAGITILENVLKRFADTFGAEYMNNIVYTPFTQRFKDNCAGVFCKISISTVMDNLCAEGGKIVLVKNQDKSIDITSNGRYNVTPDYGYSGLGSVDINVDVQGGEPLPPIEPVLQQKSIDIAENGSYSVSPDAGVDGLNRVDITVNVPSGGCVASEETRTYRMNGTYTINPTSGDCISKATVTVNVQPNLTTKTATITQNGTYTYKPSFIYKGFSQVDITVDVPPADTYIVTDDVCFSKSRYITFDATALDFSQKKNYYECWFNCSKLTEFPQINTSNGTSFERTWHSCGKLTSFPQLDLSSGTTFKEAWYNCKALISFPMVNLHNGTTFKMAWYGCIGLTEFPSIDLGKGTDFEQAWYNCSGLTSFLPTDLSAGITFSNAWCNCSALTTFLTTDLSAGTNFFNAWKNCTSLTDFSNKNLSSGTKFNNAWNGCSALTSFENVDLSAGTDFTNAWYGCSAMTSFRIVNISNATNLNFAWYRCESLTEFPLINTSKVTNFASAWDNCSKLTEFPALNMSSGTNFKMTWNGCSALTTIPQLDLSKGTDFTYAWLYCENLTNIGGFGAIKQSIDLSASAKLTVYSMMNIINQAGTVTGKTMKFGSTNLAKLTDAQKAVATSKGWSLA